MTEDRKAWRLLFEKVKEREADCPACAEPHQPGQECQQRPWDEFRDYLPIYCNPGSKCNRCGAPIFSDEPATDQPCLDCIIGEEPLIHSHPDDKLKDLVKHFSEALLAKLIAAEMKYGWNNGWTKQDWEADCQRHLLEHVAKGDPLDVAAYAAFCWYHGWRSGFNSSEGNADQVLKPPYPVSEPDKKLATDWYTWGFQSGIEAEKKAAERRSPAPEGGVVMAIEIKNRFTGNVIFRSEKAATVKEALQEANLSRANLSGADLSGADLSRANLGEQWVIQGQHRSDGYPFFLQRLTGDKEPMVKAGCRYFTLMQAEAHWTATRGGTKLFDETRAIVRAMVDVMHIRGLK